MKISILICTYNSGNYILPTIQSVLNQSFTDFELLILDNASTDNTIENIKYFNDNRIRLFKNKSNI
jgi:glycosyltransferase involved in cell wall biosynthesis